MTEFIDAAPAFAVETVFVVAVYLVTLITVRWDR